MIIPEVDVVGQGEVWIGLLNFTGRAGDPACGIEEAAWAYYLAYAEGPQEFTASAWESIEQLRYGLVGVEEVEPVRERTLSQGQLSDRLAHLATVVTESDGQLDTLHVFPRDDDSGA